MSIYRLFCEVCAAQLLVEQNFPTFAIHRGQEERLKRSVVKGFFVCVLTENWANWPEFRIKQKESVLVLYFLIKKN